MKMTLAEEGALHSIISELLDFGSVERIDVILECLADYVDLFLRNCHGCLKVVN